MKISKYLTMILPAVILLSVPSCKLDENLRDTPTQSQIKTAADLNTVLLGLYSLFNNPNGFKYKGVFEMILGADDIYSSGGSDFGPFSDRTLSSNNTQPLWDTMYNEIGNANDAIGLVEGMNIAAIDKQHALGEAHFIRGFCFYYLVRIFGGVPLRLDRVDINSNFYLPRATVDQVYTQIFSDLKLASQELPEYDPANGDYLGRATKGAAQGMLAHAYLTYGDHLSLAGQSGTTQFQNSELYADSVIANTRYTLVSHFNDLFDITKEAAAYQEVLFSIRYQTDPSASGQGSAGSEYAWRFCAPNTFGVCGETPNGQGTGSYRPNMWFADYYRTGDYAPATGPKTLANIDYRNMVSFFQAGPGPKGAIYVMYPNIPAAAIKGKNGQDSILAQGNIATPLVGKYKDPGGKDSRNNGNDFFILRLAEVYLLKAEAENELNGPTAIAATAFNKVRARARAADGTARAVPLDIVPGALTKDQFRMKIFDERGLELLGEGQRWFDLVRMRSPNSPTQTMFEYQFTKLKAAPYTTTLPAFKNNKWTTTNAVYGPSLNVSVPKFLLYPIPSTEINQNPNFGAQNTGW